jgi:hypothetical protein
VFLKERSRDLSTLLLLHKILSSAVPLGFEPRKIGLVNSLFLAEARALTSSRVDLDDVIADDVTGSPFLGRTWTTVGSSEYCSDSIDVIDTADEPAYIRCMDGGFCGEACSEVLLVLPTESLSGKSISKSFNLSFIAGVFTPIKSWASFGLSLGEGLGESLAPSGPYSPGLQCTFLCINTYVLLGLSL